MPDSLENASPDTVLDRIGPGKLIRSDVLEWIVERIRDLRDQVGTGETVEVPVFMGRTLEDARLILQEGSVSLRLGPVLDVAGNSVDPRDGANRGRIVLMQTPGPNEKTIPDRQVRLLVAAADEESMPAPVIESFGSEPVRVNEEVIIRGKHFPSLWESSRGDSVTFDGVEGTVQVAQSSEQVLVVRVPENIPGVPSSGEETTDVPITITTPGGTASGTLTVQPSSGQATPKINEIVSVDDGEIRVGGNIEIRGTGFSDTPAENKVIYGTIERDATQRTSQGIIAPVPSAQDLGISGDGQTISVKVRAAGIESESRSVFIFIPDNS